MSKAGELLENISIQEKLSMRDDLLAGFDFQELIDTVNANEPKKDEKSIMKVFEDMLKSSVSDARFMLKKHMKDILSELK